MQVVNRNHPQGEFKKRVSRNVFAGEFRAKENPATRCETRGMVAAGLEPNDVTNAEQSNCPLIGLQSGTECGTVNPDIDSSPPDLAKLVELWEHLPDTVKGDILTQAESSVNLPELPRHKTT